MDEMIDFPIVPLWLLNGMRVFSILLAVRAGLIVYHYDMEGADKPAGIAMLCGLLGFATSSAMLLGHSGTVMDLIVHAGLWCVALGLARYVYANRTRRLSDPEPRFWTWPLWGR